MARRRLLDADAIGRSLWRMAHEIIERLDGSGDLVLIGVERRGVHLARRLAGLLKSVDGRDVDVAALNTTPFRDDQRRSGTPGAIQVPVEGRVAIIVDDVLFTGRTARAAMEGVLASGRPAVIRLLVLVDRGHRELPIRPDFVGKNVPTSRLDDVEVHVHEVDGVDEVVLVDQNETEDGPVL